MKLSNLERKDEGGVRPSGRLKVIVVVGYRDTGKTTMIQRLFKRLCFRSVGHGPDANPVVGEVVSPSVSTIPTVDELSSFVENQVLLLLRMFR